MSLVVAVLRGSHGMGVDGGMVVKIAEDLKRFQCLTTGDGSNAVVMGHATFQSLGGKPLPRRCNIVLTRKHYDVLCKKAWDNVVPCRDFDALEDYLRTQSFEEVWYMGGTQIYREALERGLVRRALISRVDCGAVPLAPDVFFPMDVLEARASPVHEGRPFQQHHVRLYDGRVCDTVSCTYVEYHLNHVHEDAYLSLLRACTEAPSRSTRNGTTRAIFAQTRTFDVGTHGPVLLTTKKMAKKTVVKELLWFLGGSSDTRLLDAQGVHIWKGNTTRKFLDATGKTHLKEGSVGPLYGFNWRHFGAEWKGMDNDYTGKGVDQLARVLHLIRTDPTSRRIMMTTYDPKSVHLACLPPCHGIHTQFFVRDGRLDLLTVQRSADIFLGVPFNLFSYSLLLMMVAQQTDLKPGVMTYMFGDVHLYANAEAAAQEQLTRQPYPPPRVTLSRAKDLWSYTVDDVNVTHYKHHPPLRVTMMA